MKAAFYARVSTQEQAERNTIQAQIEFAEKYFALNNIECVDWFLDPGVSGAKPLPQRPQGGRLLHEASNGRKWDALFFFKLDRLGRDTRDTLNAIDALERAGVTLRSMTEPFDTGDPAGRMMVTVLSAFAQLERDTIRVRCMTGVDRALREGRWAGGHAPYGYQTVQEGGAFYLVPASDPIPGFNFTEADVVRDVFRMLCVDRMGPWAIADHFNALGVPTKRASSGRIHHLTGRPYSGEWKDSTVRQIVRRSVYRGVYLYRKSSADPIELHCEPLVTEATWDHAQQRMSDNLGRSKTPRRRYLLRGKVQCASCGLSYCGTTTRTTYGTYGYYRCAGSLNRRGCRSQFVPQSLDEMVWSDIEEFINNPGEILAEILAETSEGDGLTRTRQALKTISDRVASKATEKERVLALYRRGRIDDETVDAQLDAIEKEHAEALKEQKRLQSAVTNTMAAAAEYASTEALLTALRQRLDGPISFELRQEIVSELVAGVTVESTDEGTRAFATYRFGGPSSLSSRCSVQRTPETQTTEYRRVSIWRLERATETGKRREGGAPPTWVREEGSD